MTNLIGHGDAKHIESIMREWIKKLSKLSHDSVLKHKQKSDDFSDLVIIDRNIIDRTVSIMTAAANMISAQSSTVETCHFAVIAEGADNISGEGRRKLHGLD